VAVIGAGECDAAAASLAEEVGERLARSGCVLVTGGLGGVMEAASRGAGRAGGLVVGILPGAAASDANRWVDVPIATGMGDARNAVLVNTAEALIAVGGSYGTLSEIAFALRRGRPIASLGSWQVDPQVVRVATAAQAVESVLSRLGGGAR
jgi:uncharacterized protein (TIGR00725 family)